MPADIKDCSDWYANVELFPIGSSATANNIPPSFEEPPIFACLIASMALSNPGPLPYQSEKTPSIFGWSYNCIIWVPQAAVAANSSFTPGWNTMPSSFKYFLALFNSKSKVPKGEPG